MELNQTTLRGILAAITSVSQDHIVPKQGNWWNPQENAGNIENWIAYQIRSNKPKIAPFYVETEKNGSPVNSVAVQKIAIIDLQFVGPDSEDLAQNVSMWPLRSDVKEAFQTIRGAIMYTDMDAQSSTFYQDGNNTVVSWNVQIEVNWYSVLDTNQGAMPELQFEGKIR